jgi:hypothetical protein
MVVELYTVYCMLNFLMFVARYNRGPCAAFPEIHSQCTPFLLDGPRAVKDDSLKSAQETRYYN